MFFVVVVGVHLWVFVMVSLSLIAMLDCLFSRRVLILRIFQINCLCIIENVFALRSMYVLSLVLFRRTMLQRDLICIHLRSVLRIDI